ncbi:MAG: gliding motility protein GldL [Flavobacteriaceae bacterium]|nr:gliding motility protein GldL [Flavobacteriaceae bacterium]
MSSKKSVFESKKWKTMMTFIYGVGASVVIVGALFKILHWPGADLMLIIGLLTEAGIFLISAFEPVHMDADWSLVYPELAGMEGKKKGTVSQQLDKMLEDAKVTPDLISSLGTNLKSLGDNVSQMNDLSSAASATNEYAQNVTKASSSVSAINESYLKAADAMNSLASAGSNAGEYGNQMDKITKNLASLNQVYELEIAESNNQLKSISTFVTNLNGVVTSLQETESQAKSIAGEIGSLSKNLASLNTIYGNMLAAMNVSRN